MCKRCGWVGNESIYVKYHDDEWGVPEWNARALWEKLVLDGFQAGLSWLTILKKRAAFRAAFAVFDPHIVANFGAVDVERLLADKGIVRHRGKIESAIKGARVWQEIEAEQGFDNYLWNFVDGKPLQNNCKTSKDVPAFTELSTRISKDLKQRGFNYCGPTITYAFMQAVGMVNDHTVGCFRHQEVQHMAR